MNSFFFLRVFHFLNYAENILYKWALAWAQFPVYYTPSHTVCTYVYAWYIFFIIQVEVTLIRRKGLLIRKYLLLKGTVSRDFWPVLFLLKSSVWAPALMDRLKQFNDIFCFRKRYSISKCDCWNHCSRSQWLWRHLICIVNVATPTSCPRSQWLYQHVSA